MAIIVSGHRTSTCQQNEASPCTFHKHKLSESHKLANAISRVAVPVGYLHIFWLASNVFHINFSKNAAGVLWARPQFLQPTNNQLNRFRFFPTEFTSMSQKFSWIKMQSDKLVRRNLSFSLLQNLFIWPRSRKKKSFTWNNCVRVRRDMRRLSIQSGNIQFQVNHQWPYVTHRSTF